MAISAHVKLVKVDLADVMNNTKIYSERRWIDFVNEFIGGGLECAEVIDYGTVHSNSVCQRLRKVIKENGLEDKVYVIHKNKRVFLVKATAVGEK